MAATEAHRLTTLSEGMESSASTATLPSGTHGIAEVPWNPVIIRTSGGPLESSHHPYYGKCTNANSIGIEICTHNNGSNWEFATQAVNAAIELAKYLMQKFGVSADNVIRHYDVTGKSCPRVSGWGAVGGSAEWNKFKKAIGAGTATAATTTSSTEKKFYRVRKTWADSASQIGAYLILDNAIAEANNAGAKYAVFDWEGKEIYRYSEGSGSKVKEMRFFYPGYTRKESPYDSHGAGVAWYDQNKNAILVDAYTKGSGACNKLISFLLLIPHFILVPSSE